MASRSGPPRPRNRWLVPAILALLGLGTGFISWAVRDADPWWSSALINASVVFLLLVPCELALRWLWQSVERIERTTDSALETAVAAKETADRTERSLEDVRDALVERQRAELDAEVEVYRQMAVDPSRAAIVDALKHATADEIISPAGIRAPVWETTLHYRYVISDESDSLIVQLERGDGEILSTHTWGGDQPAVDFYQRLVLAVRAADEDLGTGLNLPTESVADVSDMLVTVTRLRAQELMGYRSDLRLIVERINGWYFTEDAVIPADDLHYRIDVERLNEIDWEQHLIDKGWYLAESMIPFARRLYGPQRIRKAPTNSPPTPRRTAPRRRRQTD